MNNEPNKWDARHKLHMAVKNGKVKKQPCEVCGSDESEAHHIEYEKPLEVKWLCRKHHHETHMKIRFPKGKNQKYGALFLPVELHKQIKIAAAKHGLTMIEYLNEMWQFDVKKLNKKDENLK